MIDEIILKSMTASFTGVQVVTLFVVERGDGFYRIIVSRFGYFGRGSVIVAT
ncbi:MAG: hypothetical protein MJ072_00660 [Clostridia bacterium]|nr:hypothetical protein [Clostridia bacterium]